MLKTEFVKATEDPATRIEALSSGKKLAIIAPANAAGITTKMVKFVKPARSPVASSMEMASSFTNQKPVNGTLVNVQTTKLKKVTAAFIIMAGA